VLGVAKSGKPRYTSGDEYKELWYLQVVGARIS